MHSRNPRRTRLATLVLLTVAGAAVLELGRPTAKLAQAPSSAEVAALQRNFQNPPHDSKIMVRWWWFGPAVTSQELEKEMHEMKDAGIGGFEVQPVYPLTLDEPSNGLVNLRYLSPEFLKAVSDVAHTAQELGLRMDMTMGSGWPFGGPHITPELAAERLTCIRIPLPESAQKISGPALKEGQRFLAAFVAAGDAGKFQSDSARPIAPNSDGDFVLPSSPSGPRILLFFISDLTGQQVKRATVGAEGNVLDHYSRDAIEKHMDIVGAPLEQAGGGKIRAMFCDSLEVYGSDWAANFRSEFKRRRGYDIAPYLPALFDTGGAQCAAIRHDWAQTLSELLNDNFLKPFKDWCHQHHVLARVQAYGTPPAELSSYRFVDLPEGEQGDEAGHWNHFTASRWASSASHAYGVPVTSAEAFTWLHSLSFRATPLDFKAYADQYFLEGINQIVAHGWPYSPPGIPEPGWHFYAATALNAHNPWWFAMPDLELYLQRASFMLRQGRPVTDVAVYLPTHDALAALTPGHTNLWDSIWKQLGPNILPSLLEAGYGIDFIDDEILAHNAHVESDKLAIADQEFPIVVLPGIERTTPETLSKLAEFAKRGGILVATRRLPSLAPGFQQDSQTAEVVRLVDELFKQSSAPGHFIQTEDQSLEDELARLHVPDVQFSPRSQDIGFIHRHMDVAEIYFIANTSNHRVETTATFRVHGKHAEWWNLITGEVTPASSFVAPNGETPLRLDLEPYGSRLLVFDDRVPPPALLVDMETPAPMDISKGWQVSFEGRNKNAAIDAPQSWTAIEGMKFFSGRAIYQKKIQLDAGFVQKGVDAVLNFGEPTPLPVAPKGHFQAALDGPVREAAEVFVNGRRSGTVWHPPYELDVTAFLHTGENELRIVVGNTAVNEMAGGPLPDRKQLTAKYGERFVDQGNNLVEALPSGLLGPIRLIPRIQVPAIKVGQ